ncbi:MAG: Ger(x)C family spore germination C-terminal domain-containing protein [Clostridia bacterium]|nr:Ger(x)C family spore germination C-terminal domain-containing protein [Clostridia bacterium]
MIRKYTPILYWAIIIALLGLFFTNDFGLVDIHKTSFIVAVAVDFEDEEVQVTAQVAVPQPSTSGDNTQYVEVQGSGYTIADALNEINAKTGTYPKLLFCKLILLGDSCKDKELFQALGCFYRRNYSELTALVAMCEGKAQEMLARPATIDPDNSTAIQKVLSDELEKSGNVSKANLKSIAESNYSVSKSCYMPYIQVNVQGTSKPGGEGDNAGGDKPQGGGGGESGGEGQSGDSSGGSSSGSGGESGGKEEKPVEFTARQTAIFSNGKFAGILNERQAFALNVLENDINLAVMPCTVGDINYTMGLKSVDGGIDFKVDKGVPSLTVSFKATAQVQGIKKIMEPNSVFHDDVVQSEVLKATEQAVEERFKSLIETSIETDCDVLGIKKLLHKYNYKYYDAFKDDILSRMQVEYKINIKSLN